MAWKKGERARVTYKNEELTGTIFKGGANKVQIVLDGTNQVLSGHPSLLQPTDTEAPITYSEGTRVSFPGRDGETIKGTVTKGGAFVKVTHDGGEMVTSGHVSVFTPDNTLPEAEKGPDPMEEFSVSRPRYSSIMGMEGKPWAAKILKNGKAFATITDRGDGGSTILAPTGPGTVAVLREAEAKAKEWTLRYHPSSKGEYLDLWVSWWLHKRPFNVTSKAYLEEIEGWYADLDERRYSKQEEDQSDPGYPIPTL